MGTETEKKGYDTRLIVRRCYVMHGSWWGGEGGWKSIGRTTNNYLQTFNEEGPRLSRLTGELQKVVSRGWKTTRSQETHNH